MTTRGCVLIPGCFKNECEQSNTSINAHAHRHTLSHSFETCFNSWKHFPHKALVIQKKILKKMYLKSKCMKRAAARAATPEGCGRKNRIALTQPLLFRSALVFNMGAESELGFACAKPICYAHPIQTGKCTTLHRSLFRHIQRSLADPFKLKHFWEPIEQIQTR